MKKEMEISERIWAEERTPNTCKINKRNSHGTEIWEWKENRPIVNVGGWVGHSNKEIEWKWKYLAIRDIVIQISHKKVSINNHYNYVCSFLSSLTFLFQKENWIIFINWGMLCFIMNENISISSFTQIGSWGRAKVTLPGRLTIIRLQRVPWKCEWSQRWLASQR